MPTKRGVKKLNKDIVLAIDWAASEYKYVKELQQELEKINGGREPLKNLRKASKILYYVSRAERRADRFEERATKQMEDLYKELEQNLKEQFGLKDLTTALSEIVKELGVERAHLVNYSSVYDGLLAKELDQAAAEEQLEEKIKEENPEKAQKIHTSFLQLLGQIEYQVKDTENWISALDASLKKAQKVLDKLPDEEKNILLKEGLAILNKYCWPNKPYKKSDETTRFMAQHPADLEEMAKATAGRTYALFYHGLPTIKELMNEKTWPEIIKIVETLGRGSGDFFRYRKGFITKKNWPEIVQFVEKNKEALRHALYSGKSLHFFRNVDGKLGIIRENLQKTGSETIVLGGSLIGKAIIRIITDKAFQSWKKAFEAEKVWRELGFDYVPIEPILKRWGKLRAFKTKEGLWRVSTRVLGPTWGEFITFSGYETNKKELLLMQEKIIDGLNNLKINHGHLHDDNFCIEFHDEKIRLYAIDFDQAVS